jgi:hypothetical protein
MSTSAPRMSFAALAWMLATGLTLSAPQAAWSVSQRQLSVEDMADLADEVVVGRVVSSEARWQGKLIVTVSRVQVDESLKGQVTNTVEITQLGGTAVHPVIGAAVTMTASEQVTLRTGENVLLFLQKGRTGTRQVVGGPQGKFVVRTEPTTGATDLPVGPKQLTVRRGAEEETVATEVMTLDAMRQRLHAHLARRHPQGGKTP